MRSRSRSPGKKRKSASPHKKKHRSPSPKKRDNSRSRVVKNGHAKTTGPARSHHVNSTFFGNLVRGTVQTNRRRTKEKPDVIGVRSIITYADRLGTNYRELPVFKAWQAYQVAVADRAANSKKKTNESDEEYNGRLAALDDAVKAAEEEYIDKSKSVREELQPGSR